MEQRKKRLLELNRRLEAMQIPTSAANASYFLVLSIFPMLVLVLHLLRYLNMDAADLLRLLEGFLPEALLPSVEKLIVNTYAHTTAAMASVSAVGALWSASRGVYGLFTGLNTVYGVEETRGWLYARGLSLLYTFLFLLVLLLTLLLNVFGDLLKELLPRLGMLEDFLQDVLDLRFWLMLLLQIGLFSAMYTALPTQKNRWQQSLPGAVLAALGWTIFSQLFSVYVEQFPRYSSIYGSVYAVALGMLWLYCCMSIVFYGGALNKLLADWNKGKI